jgi:hypothetical protein
MIKRIEFTLNLDDPGDAELYRALKPSLRYRRAGAVIRLALRRLLLREDSRAVRPITPYEDTHDKD